MILLKGIKLLLTTGCMALIYGCEPITPQKSTLTKRLIYDNYEYANNIGYARILPGNGDIINELENPVMILGQREKLVLDFDLIVENFEFLSAKIIHCSKDWSKSRLQELDYLNGINNFRINEFNNSLNTRYKYVNYKFPVPIPLQSGNYLLVVFRRGNPEDILLSRKFVAVENTSIINTLVKQSTTVAKRRINQQVEISINYGKLNVNSPFEDISIAVIQNHNWNTVLKNIPPTMVRPNENYLEYKPLGLELNYPGWSEFRFFDLRTINVTGRNVAKISNVENEIHVELRTDQSKRFKPYSLDFNDINGRYLIKNNDPGRPMLSSEYSNVLFRIESPIIEGKVYVTGQFSNWKIEDKYRMIYNKATKAYEKNIFLKQGYYEYRYYVSSDTPESYFFEGSHFETENEYEVFVYYRAPGTVNDRVIGYRKFGSIVN